MSLTATLCTDCRRVRLAARDVSGECKSCGGRTRAIPGPSFEAADRELFHELGHIIADGCITRSEAEEFATEAQRALWSGAYSTFIVRLTVRLPTLLRTQVVVGRNSGGQRRMIVILKTICEALSASRSSNVSERPLDS
jgi:hypothetical protein